MTSPGWFEVDKAGLARIQARRGKGWIVNELIQNAWDTRATRVDVRLEALPGRPVVRVSVEDDDPDGFARLADCYTLFGDSTKRGDPSLRGRFCLGEKLVLALCVEAEIVSTSGAYKFGPDGRRRLARRTEAGSKFVGTVPMTRLELEDVLAQVDRLIPPIPTFVNDRPVEVRVPIAQFDAALPTEIADAEGVLRKSVRRTTVRIYEPRDGESGALYELGIPVVETGDRWIVDVAQKVPLTMERDAVPPSYLRALRVGVVNALASRITAEDAAAPWVADAIEDRRISDDAIRAILDRRFGENRVAVDPSDPEAVHRAAAEGFVVVHGGSLSRGAWENARRAQAVPAAGRVFPTPRPYSNDPDAPPVEVVDPSTIPGALALIGYAARIGARLLGHPVPVRIVRTRNNFAAAYGRGLSLDLNVGRLGARWFREVSRVDLNDLLVHEFAHEAELDHLSANYHKATTRLGAVLAEAALETPDLFSRTWGG